MVSKKWKFDSKYSFTNKNFAKIYNFFVINTPVENVSVRGIPFKDRNINILLLNKFIKTETNLNNEWHIVTLKEMPDVLSKCELDNELSNIKEIAVHTKNKSGNTESFFYAIRCSFAHGGFQTFLYNKEKYYMLENNDRDKIKGRIVIKEKSLLKIINYCLECEKNKIK